MLNNSIENPLWGEYRRPTFFSGGSRFGEALAVSCRGPVVFLARALCSSSKMSKYFESCRNVLEIRRSGRFEKSPSVRRAKSRSIYACAHGLFSAKRFGNPRSWSRACLLYVVMSSFLASLLGRTFGGFGVALGAIWLHFGAWRHPKGTKNQSSFMTAFWNAKKYGPSKF